MNPNLYAYCSKDLLQEPEYYMYSAYHGDAFLDAYRKFRSEKLAVIEEYLAVASKAGAQIESELGIFFASSDCGKSPLAGSLLIDEAEDVISRRPEDFERIESLRILKACCVAEMAGRAANDLYFWNSYFVKRFEVGKKLYREYRPVAKRAGTHHDEPLPYALLGATLGHAFLRTGNLKMLNACLKLNDLLCSWSFQKFSRDELLTASAGLRWEITAVSEIAGKAGLRL